MKKILALSLVLGVVSACETPNDPDFKLDQKIQTPLLVEKTFTFLGGSSALIDTTSENFSSVFTTGNDGLVSLSKEENFDFRDLDDAIPEVSVNPTTPNAQVGELRLDDFSSQSDEGNLGEANFQEITGLDPALFPAGITIPGGSGSTTINLTTDYFISATIKNDGNLIITLQNDLGFNIDNLTLDLRSNGSSVGNTNISPFNDGSEESGTIIISAGTVLENLSVEVTASWALQQMSSNPDRLVVEDLQGQNLVASQVQAALPSQDFFSSGTATVDQSAFRFNASDHFVEIESGELVIDQIVNNIDIELDTLQISFPDLRTDPYDPADSLVILFAGPSSIPRSSSGATPPTKNRDLSGLRIFAQGGTVDFNIRGATERTQGTQDSIRTINETDDFSADVSVNILSISEAFGEVVERDVLLNDDVPGNGQDAVDLFNDQEAVTLEISALEELSDQLDGIEFDNPTLSINYLTNIGIPTTVFGSIIGINSKNEQVYLSGLTGSVHRVSSGEIPPELQANGSSLNPDQMIKFDLDPVGDVNSPETKTIQFDKTQTNVDQFLNNLPSNIRFIGLATVSPGSQEGSVSDPVQFDPSLSVDIPLNFSATQATFEDTTDSDLSDLPDPSEDDQRLTEADLAVGYTNNLPFEVTVTLQLLDDAGQEVTTIPRSDQQPLVLEAASVNPSTGFVESSSEGDLVISLNQDQLDILNRARSAVVQVVFNTTNQGNVKVRGDDSVSLTLSLKAAIESTVN